MSILGKAIGSYVTQLKGLYAIELPNVLRDEMLEIINSCNKDQDFRAVLVLDDTGALTTPYRISWNELLKWRTDDDRIFVWERGSREPDTSFKSAVKPFISSRFPGEPSGGCTLDLFAAISVNELWRQQGDEPIGDSYDAFLTTAEWLVGVLRVAFEMLGSSPSTHWSDYFLIHWAKVLEDLNNAITVFKQDGDKLQPRHAWELIRVAGFPVPDRLLSGGNPFLDPPKVLPEKEWSKFAQFWQNVTSDYVAPEGRINFLLTALDQLAIGATNITGWRGLGWSETSKYTGETGIELAPILGNIAFTSAGSPGFLSKTIPTYPHSPKPAWWGVNEANIRAAIDILESAKLFEPSNSSKEFYALFPGRKDIYLLLTRDASTSIAMKSKKYSTNVRLQNLRLIFKESWRKLILSTIAPDNLNAGEAWINPDNIRLTAAGTSITITSYSKVGGEQLELTFDLDVAFPAKIDDVSQNSLGVWNPIRNLKLTTRIGYLSEQGIIDRPVDVAFKVIIPSPYSPIVILAKKDMSKVIAEPGEGDEFILVKDGREWQVEHTPDIILQEEGEYNLFVYDARIEPDGIAFKPVGSPHVNGGAIKEVLTTGLYMRLQPLDEGDVITIQDSDEKENEVAVIRVQQRSDALSSGLLSAVRGQPAGKKQPSTETRNSLLGRYQDHVVQAIQSVPEPSTYNSLYQYVIPSNENLITWPQHDGNPSPKFLLDLSLVEKLPGIDNGPSNTLVSTDEWVNFMLSFKEVAQSIGFEPTINNRWLSGFNPGNIPAKYIRNYTNAHTQLVIAAKKISEADEFWASYPFSVIIVDGRPGPQYGQLQAIFLSPLHPARLAWSFAVAFVAINGGLSRGLVGLAEGWNIPITGSAVSVTGQRVQLVSVPINPGSDQDFAAWSALTVIDNTGLAKLPAIASGLPVPWGGLTGINHKVIEHAIKDYLSVHPHINSLEVDIRAVSEAPRSEEVDNSLLKLLGTGVLSEIQNLGGGIRIWDSDYRSGFPPTRDDLFAAREEVGHDGSFEWSSYQPPAYPKDADLALIENSSMHLAIIPGNTEGMLGLLPLKRFCPQDISSGVLNQSFRPRRGEDLLGLSDLLREIEYGFEDGSALRSSPQKNAIGIGLGARWEILGTFNIDPALLSSLVSSVSPNLQDKRLLWEWRPAWLAFGQPDLARRPYYVIGRVPAPVIKALEIRQGLSANKAEELLLELGRRGIGLTSLYAAGGTQESAAAGFFYAIKLLIQYSQRVAMESTSTQVFGLVPLDPIDPVLSEIAGNEQKNRRRADLLMTRILQVNNTTNICFVPVEVKHHGEQRNPEAFPPNSHEELKRAREQLQQTKDLLVEIAGRMQATSDTLSEMISCSAKRIGLATLLDLMISFAPQPPTQEIRGNILRNVIDGSVSIGVGDPVLLWFAPGSVTFSGEVISLDPYKELQQTEDPIRELFIDPAAIPGIWWSDTSGGPEEQRAQEKFDQVLEEAWDHCNAGSTLGSINNDLRIKLTEEIFGRSDEETHELTTKIEQEQEKPESIVTSEAVVITEENEYHPLEKEPLESGSLPEDKELPDDSKDNDTFSAQEAKSIVPPKAFIGWNETTTRWGIIGRLPGLNEPVALDFDHPKTMGIFGYMGSGKSYLLGNIMESALEEIPGINTLTAPLSVIIFNYRRNASDRFELSSLTLPNQKKTDVEELASTFGAQPKGIKDVLVLSLPGELNDLRKEEYGLAGSSELFFAPDKLSVEDWELLMGEPGSNAVFARTIRSVLLDLRLLGEITFENLQDRVLSKLGKQSAKAAELRFEFVQRYLSEKRGTNFESLLKPGRALVIDLRQPLFNKDDAMRFFLVCANSISKVQGQFNKLIVFDEAHEYLSDEFGEKLDNRIRNMRHEGTSYVFATQDVGSIPTAIRRFITTRFVFSLGTRQNVEDLIKFAPEFKEQKLLGIDAGFCWVQAGQSIHNLFERPRLVQIRPRATQHGGASRIFTSEE